MAIDFFSSINLNKNELQNAVVQNLGSAPTSPVEGQIYYDTGDDTIYFRNGSAWVSIGGDITGVTAGDGMTGGGTSGAVTLNVVGGNGITANANDVAITAAQTTITSVLNASLTLGRDAHNQIDFSTDNQIKFKTNNETPVIIMKASGEIEATKFDGALEGNADTATALATGRTINGTSFDGTGNITLGNDSVTNAMMDDDAIDSAQLVDGSIDTVHIADDQVTLAKMAGLASTKFILGNGSGNPAAVSMSGDATMSNTGAVTITGSTGDFTVGGDLTVSGTTTTVNSTTVSIADPIFELGADGSDDNLDRGLKMKYNSSGAKIAFMGFDDSSGKFTMIPDATDSSSVFSGTAGTLVMSTFEGNLTGDVTGNADTVTTNANLTGHITSSGNAAVLGSFTVAQLSSALSNASISGNNTGDEPDAAADTKGIVELATSAEVLTGTDAARAITPDTLAAKSVVATITQSSLTDDNRVTITHSLGTADVIVQLFDMTTEANVYADIARTTNDMSTASTSVITIDFGRAPENDVRCLITSLKGATVSDTIAYT